MRRGQWFWGLILILLGGLFLTDAMGIRLPNGMSAIDLFWPVALVLAGLWVLSGVFFRGSVEMETASIDLQGAREASLRINHGAGELRVHSGAGADQLVRGSFTGGLDHKDDRIGEKLEVRMRPAREAFDFPFFGPHFRLDWDMSLNADIPTALTMNLGASRSMIDLRDLRITEIKLETGASDTQLILPSRGRLRADLDFGAASLEITVPEGVSARIRASLGAADLRIDRARFPQSGNTYQSPDYDSAVNAVDMTIDGGAASVKIR